MPQIEINQKYITIDYGEVHEIPFPEGIVPKAFLGGKFFIVSNGKFFRKRFGVVDIHGNIILPISMIGSLASFNIIEEESILFENYPHGYTLYSSDGKEIVKYKNIVSLGNRLLAVSNNGKNYALAGIDGKNLTDAVFDVIRPFSGDLAIAIQGKSCSVFGTDGNMLFTLADITEIRDFCDGYAVFRKGDSWGAIDKLGGIALEPRWAFLRNAEFGAFVFSESREPKINIDNCGLVTAGGKIAVSCRYKNLEQMDANYLKYGTVIFYQHTEGNKQYTSSGLAWGLMDYSGRQIVPEGMFSLGTKSEGLRAYSKYYSDDHIEFGYLNDDWESVSIVSKIGKTTLKDAFNFGITEGKSLLFGYGIDYLLMPFLDGKARVRLSPDGHLVKEGRWIDRDGNAASPGTLASPGHVALSSTPDRKAELKAMGRLQGRYRPTEDVTHKSCRRIAGDLWEIESYAGKYEIVLSKMESIGGYSCGLLPVRDSTTGKKGFVNEKGKVIVHPKYDDAIPFKANRCWARIGKRYYILRRDMTVHAEASVPASPEGPGQSRDTSNDAPSVSLQKSRL
ncbi:MAG: WG repeat-containing protein [Deltaproteobacteria bacterium]|jgi:hypothetical protein|nr:WG repeat-containing protein [Deltaproteobacteria bacterium]